MTHSVITVKTFDEACIAPFIELAATYYPVGDDARDPTYLRWIFLHGPAGPGRVVYAARPDGSWSGVMGMVPFRIRKGAETLLASMVVNVLVHPEHRKEKLFVKMIEKTREEFARTDEWLIGHPNEAAVHGWRRTGMAFRPGYEIRVVPPFLGLRRESGVRVKDAVSPALSLDFSPLAAWQARLESPVIEVDAAFLRWRFLTHPSRSYRVYVHTNGNQIVGYRVDRAFRTPAVRWLVDWQGEESWACGPAAGILPSILAWPIERAAPPRSYLLPRLRKRYEFFATHCAAETNDADSWQYLTLAATDFA